MFKYNIIWVALSALARNIQAEQFTSKNDLITEVNSYCQSPQDYDSSVYGDINEWDVSQITNMANLFAHQDGCNPNISAWDVEAVKNFDWMLFRAPSFNADISGWNVSSGTNFDYMFSGATSFNRNISGWNVSSGTNFSAMFSEATLFDTDISVWNVSSGQDFSYMFSGATSFNEKISGWDVSSGTNFVAMFMEASSFNQDISKWDVSPDAYFAGMFSKATSFHQNLSSWPQEAKDAPSFCLESICDQAPCNPEIEDCNAEPCDPNIDDCSTTSPTANPTSLNPTTIPTSKPSFSNPIDPCDSVEEHLSNKFARIPKKGKTGDCEWLKERSNELIANVCLHRTKYWTDPSTETVYAPAQEACPITCNTCDVCYENPKTRYTKYMNKRGTLIIGRCKHLNKSKIKDKICNAQIANNIYPTAVEACPQSCGLPGC